MKHIMVILLLIFVFTLSGCGGAADPIVFLKGFQSVEELYKTSRSVQEQQVATAISIHAIAKVAVTRPLKQSEVKEIRVLIAKLKKSERIRKVADMELEAIWKTQIIGDKISKAKGKMEDMMFKTKLALQLMKAAKDVFK